MRLCAACTPTINTRRTGAARFSAWPCGENADKPGLVSPPPGEHKYLEERLERTAQALFAKLKFSRLPFLTAVFP